MNKTNWSKKEEKRFWSKVILPEDLVTDCWIWNSSKNKCGYGEFWFRRTKKISHKLAYEYYNGYMPIGKEMICHKCDNPSCVNPNHLWAGTHLENMNDKKVKKRAASKEKIHTFKYEDDIIIDILEKIKTGKIKRHSDLIKEKVSPRNIMAVLRGEYRHDIGELYDLEKLKKMVRVQFTTEQVVNIKKELLNGKSAYRIAKDLRVSYSSISKIKLGKTFKNIKI
ncbi:MAG: HNH endonuclease [Melioribacteraceae bacterium]|nr:HNH endonuclease [Melioribacteraceae bacterium]